MKPFFSIVVPVYNVELYLERCIMSLINQTYKNLEVILVNDGSSDTSGDICERYSHEYKNIITVHKENGGLASARNEGLKYAIGKYVSFVDSDDWVELTMYEVLYNRLKDSNSDMLVFGYQKVNNGQIVIQEHAYFPEGIYDSKQIKEKILPDSISRKKAFNQVNLPVQLSACMNVYQNDFLKEQSIIFESERIILNEDWLFNIKCLCRASEISVIHDIFYNYDTRDNSLSMSYKADAYERRHALFKRYCEEISCTNNNDIKVQKRLRNFWLESIYNCVVIELYSKEWGSENKKRIKEICKDKQFSTHVRQLKVGDCTIKGWIFILLMKLGMLSLFRSLYFVRQNKKVGK